MTRIKFCGLREREHVEAAVRLADYIGFVFAKSKRQVTLEEAARLRRDIPSTVQVVGVFVSPTYQQVTDAVEQVALDLVQIHGVIPDGELPVPVIQAIPVTDIAEIEQQTEYLLVDAPVAGSGETFDWSRDIQADRPLFIAGGLTAGNVGEAIKRYHPFAVDVSSGIETDGRKDPIKMQAFADAVKEREA